MYAKGFVNGIMFNELFSNNLFFDIAKTENDLAEKLYNELKSLGIDFLFEQETNQIFPIFENKIIKKLSEYICFEIWSTFEDKTCIRFVTSFLTTDFDINNAINIIKEIL
jgi:threonine aldolase